MSYFSDLDIALKEKARNRGREKISIDSVGVCLDDTGQPVELYIVNTIYACGSMDVFLLNGPDDQEPRQVHKNDFWALT
jgi:hypothetical protein